MAIPTGGSQMSELLASYREAWRSAGHPGNGKVMLAFHMFCAPDQQQAYSLAGPEITRYLTGVVDAASDWGAGASSKDYPGYDKLIDVMKRETFATQVEKRSAWVGTPADIREMIVEYDRSVGGFDEASLQVNVGNLSLGDAKDSMRLFAAEVMPHFS
jgi:alkanesulfonate monooxygenase SsuD/methylene tetrahydromethanopterin reductase-like flavin-dependent oxidoreductase (luciferase family)